MRPVRSLRRSWNDSNAKWVAECPGRLCCLEWGDPERPSKMWRDRHFCDNRPEPQSKFWAQKSQEQSFCSDFSQIQHWRSQSRIAAVRTWTRLQGAGPPLPAPDLCSRQAVIRWWSTWASVTMAWTVRSAWGQCILYILEDATKARRVGGILQLTDLWCHDAIYIGKLKIFSETLRKSENRNVDRVGSSMRTG